MDSINLFKFWWSGRQKKKGNRTLSWWENISIFKWVCFILVEIHIVHIQRLISQGFPTSRLWCLMNWDRADVTKPMLQGLKGVGIGGKAWLPLCFSSFHIWARFLQGDLQVGIWRGPGFRLSFLFSLLEVHPACKERLTPSSSFRVQAREDHPLLFHFVAWRESQGPWSFHMSSFSGCVGNFPCWLPFYQRWALKFKWGGSAGGVGCMGRFFQAKSSSDAQDILQFRDTDFMRISCLHFSM